MPKRTPPIIISTLSGQKATICGRACFGKSEYNVWSDVPTATWALLPFFSGLHCCSRLDLALGFKFYGVSLLTPKQFIYFIFDLTPEVCESTFSSLEYESNFIMIEFFHLNPNRNLYYYLNLNLARIKLNIELWIQIFITIRIPLKSKLNTEFVTRNWIKFYSLNQTCLANKGNRIYFILIYLDPKFSSLSCIVYLLLCRYHQIIPCYSCLRLRCN